MIGSAHTATALYLFGSYVSVPAIELGEKKTCSVEGTANASRDCNRTANLRIIAVKYVCKV